MAYQNPLLRSRLSRAGAPVNPNLLPMGRELSQAESDAVFGDQVPIRTAVAPPASLPNSTLPGPSLPGRSIGRGFIDSRTGSAGYATFSTPPAQPIRPLDAAGVLPNDVGPQHTSPLLETPPAAENPHDLSKTIVPFENSEDVIQQEDEFQDFSPPSITQLIQMEHQRHMDFISQQNAQLDALDNPDAAPEPPPVPPPSTPRPSKKPMQFVSSNNKPQWSDVLGGGEEDNIYAAYKTSGRKPKAHVYAPSTERFYERTLDRFDKTKRPADARRVNRYNARIAGQNG